MNLAEEEISQGSVSILTRPEGRVQRPGMPERGMEVQVSILTRPEGRVQQGCGDRGRSGSGFQSSPGPRVGCNSRWKWPGSAASRFQSSPGPRVGCNGAK